MALGEHLPAGGLCGEVPGALQGLLPSTVLGLRRKL